MIVHPDILTDFGLWASLGDRILVENMDPRKPIGRNTSELRQVFSRLPDARFCFDIAHALQVDPTVSVAVEILLEFGDRLPKLHISVTHRNPWLFIGLVSDVVKSGVTQESGGTIWRPQSSMLSPTYRGADTKSTSLKGFPKRTAPPPLDRFPRPAEAH